MTTAREKEFLAVVDGYEKATPRQIGEIMSITSGYAEQLCNILVRKRKLVKKGKFYEVNPGFYDAFTPTR